MGFANPAEGEGTSVVRTPQLQVSSCMNAAVLYPVMLDLKIGVPMQASFPCCECEPRDNTDNWSRSA